MTLSGCSLELQSMPAPQGVSGPTYQVTAQFSDIQTLLIGAKVKMSGVVVGDVEKISTSDYVANVKMAIEDRFKLAADSTFQIQFSTPLGEDFIAVTQPPGTSSSGAVLGNGATVKLSNTTTAPSIEDTFAAISLLLNGGGLDQIHTIATQLEVALDGHTTSVRDVLTQLDVLARNVNSHTGDIDHVLTSLNRLSAELNQQTPLITAALSAFPPAIQLVANDTAQIRTLLARVSQLGASVGNLLQQSQSNILAIFDNLRPTLDSLRATDSTLIPTFNSLINFGNEFQQAAPGDYVNSAATVDILWDAPAVLPAKGGNSSGENVFPAQAGPAGTIASVLGGGSR